MTLSCRVLTSIIQTFWKIYSWSNLNLLSPNIACSRTDHSSQENQPPNLRGIESITARRCVTAVYLRTKYAKSVRSGYRQMQWHLNPSRVQSQRRNVNWNEHPSLYFDFILPEGLTAVNFLRHFSPPEWDLILPWTLEHSSHLSTSSSLSEKPQKSIISQLRKWKYSFMLTHATQGTNAGGSQVLIS